MAIPPILQVQAPTRAVRQSQAEKSSAARYQPPVTPRAVYVPPASIVPRAGPPATSPATFSRSRAPAPLARAAGARAMQPSQRSANARPQAAQASAVQALAARLVSALNSSSSPWAYAPDGQQNPSADSLANLLRGIAGTVSEGAGALGQPYLQPLGATNFDRVPNAHIPGGGYNEYKNIPNVVRPWPGTKVPKVGKPYYGGGGRSIVIPQV